MGEAVTPNINPVVQIFGTLKKEQDKTFEGLKEKDEAWARFADSEFYFLIKEYADHLIESLENLEGQAWESNASSDELVIRRAVMKLTKANLSNLIRKADGARRSNQGGVGKGTSVP